SIPAALAGHPLGAIPQRATIKDVAMRMVTARQLMLDLDACDVEGVRREELAKVANNEAGRKTKPIERPAAGGRAAERPAASPPGTTPKPASAHGPAAPAQDVPPAQLLGAERRPLTVVCCALTAAGPAFEVADVEEIDDLLGDVQAAFAEIAQ